MLCLPSANAVLRVVRPLTVDLRDAELTIPDQAELPAGISPAVLREYVAGLVVRLRKLAFPAPPRA